MFTNLIITFAVNS